jgi:exosome complex protein LRP1
MDPQTDLPDLVEDLEVNIDELTSTLSPLLSTPLSTTATSLPLLDKAKLYVLAAYAIESLLFSTLQASGVDAKSHALFAELARLRTYFANERYDRERAERTAREKARAAEKARALVNRKFEEESEGDAATTTMKTTPKKRGVDDDDEESNNDVDDDAADTTPAAKKLRTAPDGEAEGAALPKRTKGRSSGGNKGAGETPATDAGDAPTPARSTRSAKALQVGGAEASPASAAAPKSKSKSKSKGKGKGKAK